MLLRLFRRAYVHCELCDMETWHPQRQASAALHEMYQTVIVHITTYAQRSQNYTRSRLAL